MTGDYLYYVKGGNRIFTRLFSIPADAITYAIGLRFKEAVNHSRRKRSKWADWWGQMRREGYACARIEKCDPVFVLSEHP